MIYSVGFNSIYQSTFGGVTAPPGLMAFLVEIKGLVSLVNIYRRAPDLEIIANNIVVVVQFSIKPLIISDFGPV